MSPHIMACIVDPALPLPAGIGRRAAAHVAELRAAYSAAAAHVASHMVMRDPHDVVVAMTPYMIGRAAESLWVLPLDSRSRLATAEPVELHRGTVDGCDAGPREVLRCVLRCDSAIGMIVVHNHPTGDASPSPADIAVTRRIISAGQACDLPLRDHIIIARGGAWMSLRRDQAHLWGAS